MDPSEVPHWALLSGDSYMKHVSLFQSIWSLVALLSPLRSWRAYILSVSLPGKLLRGDTRKSHTCSLSCDSHMLHGKHSHPGPA